MRNPEIYNLPTRPSRRPSNEIYMPVRSRRGQAGGRRVSHRPALIGQAPRQPVVPGPTAPDHAVPNYDRSRRSSLTSGVIATGI